MEKHHVLHVVVEEDDITDVISDLRVTKIQTDYSSTDNVFDQIIDQLQEIKDATRK